MDRAKSILQRYNVRPKKSLGQSFLVDDSLMQSLVESAGFAGSDIVVEIGAGAGTMTRLIARRVERLYAIELDRGLVEALREEMKEERNVVVIGGDILDYDFSEPLKEQNCRSVKVVGNIPYHLTSPILFRLIDNRRLISKAVLMMQQEVAERLLAPPGTKDYGIPTVILGMYAEIHSLMSISPRSFYPPPKVTSTVLAIDFRDHPRLELQDERFFKLVVRAAFGSRRKTLFNNLRAFSESRMSAAQIRDVLESLGIDGQRRAETLTVEEFGRVSNALAGTGIEGE